MTRPIVNHDDERHHEDFQLKDTNPLLGERWPSTGGARGNDKLTGTYDLVEQMYYLYIRVVKARYVSLIN